MAAAVVGVRPAGAAAEDTIERTSKVWEVGWGASEPQAARGAGVAVWAFGWR